MNGCDREEEDAAALRRELARRVAPGTGVDRAFRDIHLTIADAARAARPLCVASGRCCRFEAFGHRLYVTALEAAWVLDRLRRERARTLSARELEGAVAAGTCPFLDDGLCTVHTVRPFACRTFYCDPASTAWQQALHERCHDAVRALHEGTGAPYRYGEWRAILATLIEP